MKAYVAYFDDPSDPDEIAITESDVVQPETAAALFKNGWSPTKKEAVQLLYKQEKDMWEYKADSLTHKMEKL